MVRVCLSAFSLLLAASSALAAPPPREVADEDVDFTIGRLKRYLYDQQRPDGQWTPWHSQGPVGGTTVQLPTFSFVTVTTPVYVPDGGTVLLGGIRRLGEGRNALGKIIGSSPL